MLQTGASGVGVVGVSGCLVGHISASDIKDMGSQLSMRKLFISIEVFLMAKVTGQVVPRLLHVTHDQTLADLFVLFREHYTHRVHVVDSHLDLKAIGVITLADVLSLFAVTFPTRPVGLNA